MKRYLINFMVILTGVIMNVGLVSCRNDDDSSHESGGDSGERHNYVDLGLPSGTLWATCNVGAERPEDYGDFFAWGETTGYKNGKTHYFGWDTYKYCNGTYTTITKYCTNRSYGKVDIKTELEPTDDAATANWGIGWQMPSLDQLQELINTSYTTINLITQNDVYGLKITSKSNGNSIFLPTTIYPNDVPIGNAGNHGYYWSRTLNVSNNDDGCALGFYSNDIRTFYCRRFFGISVRPVRVQK